MAKGAKGEFDMYLCAGGGGGGLWYFPLINQHLLRGGQKKNPEIIRGGLKKMKGKNKEIIIAHPLDKLWMLPYEKIFIHLRETATNSAKIHSLARQSKHLHINQIQLRFLHFNQHSLTFLGIHLRHSAYKEKNILTLTPTFEPLTSPWKSLGKTNICLSANAIH